MKDLTYSLKILLKHNKEGSYSTQANRESRLNTIMKQLPEMGSQLKNVRNLKPKHVRMLVERWQSEGLSSGTIKNRMSDLRWLAEKIGKPDIVAPSNDDYEINRRKYVDNSTNKAKQLTEADLAKVTNPHVRLSLRLQATFGLRREEAIKFRVKVADKGLEIRLMPSWCKGGRERTVPVRTVEQRQLLDEIKTFCRQNKCNSLIPSEKRYIQQLKAYKYQTERHGINRNHGLRHQYAQDRYRELTGWEPPNCGGKKSRDLTPEERQIDAEARQIISNELGHNRLEITATYLGK